MTRNFNNVLKRARVLLCRGKPVSLIFREVVDDFALTTYEKNELEEELYLNSDSYDVIEYGDELLYDFG